MTGFQIGAKTAPHVQLAPRQLDLFRAPKPGQAPSATALKPQLVSPPAPTPVEPHRLPAQTQVTGLAKSLAQKLAHHVGSELKVLLTVHDNKSTMISFRRQPPLLKVRLHHLFLEAPDTVIEAIADYAARGRRASGRVLDEFIARHQERIKATASTPTSLVARGECFDLQALFDEMNAQYFGSAITARIGWGRNTSKRRRKSIRLGVYDHKAREIRIHPALDKPDVPRFFVAFIVFHEMLHQLFPSGRDTGRNVHHPRAFRAREKTFAQFAAAMQWEREHLGQLLRR